MAFSVVSATDTTGTHAAALPLLTSAIHAAGRIWQPFLVHDAPIEIELSIAVYYAPGGTATANSNASVRAGASNGIEVYFWGAASELQTGIDPNGPTPDIRIIVDPNFLDQWLWFDPTPDTYDGDLPVNRFDAVSIMMHEIGHGLGLEGWKRFSDTLQGNYMSAFDQFITRRDGIPWFDGPIAQAVYGGSVPLTVDNAIHYGNTAGRPGSELVPGGLMNGVSAYISGRAVISELDLAILQDTGLDTRWSYNGTSGNDVLHVHLSGSVNGGAGRDVAIFDAARGTYSINATSGGLSVTNGTWQTNQLSSIERLQFSDAIIAFDTSGNAGDAYRICQAAFDRTPDRPGLSYWVNQMDDGMPLSQVALNFILSPEFAATYGNINAMSNSQFVNVVYQNVLHRAPDTGGFNYWMNDLSNGYPRHYMLAAFSQSAENQANVAAAIQNGILLDLGVFV